MSDRSRAILSRSKNKENPLLYLPKHESTKGTTSEERLTALINWSEQKHVDLTEQISEEALKSQLNNSQIETKQKLTEKQNENNEDMQKQPEHKSKNIVKITEQIILKKATEWQNENNKDMQKQPKHKTKEENDKKYIKNIVQENNLKINFQSKKTNIEKKGDKQNSIKDTEFKNERKKNLRQRKKQDTFIDFEEPKDEDDKVLFSASESEYCPSSSTDSESDQSDEIPLQGLSDRKKKFDNLPPLPSSLKANFDNYPGIIYNFCFFLISQTRYFLYFYRKYIVNQN